MNDETGKVSSVRKLLIRELGGVDQSQATQFSDETVYELLNLRPARGSYEQTPLIGGLKLNISSGSS